MRRYMIFFFLTVLLFTFVSAFAGERMPSNNIHVDFDLEHNRVIGISRIDLPAGTSASLNLSGLRILSASINGMPVIIDPDMTELKFEPASGDDVIEIRYEAQFRAEPANDKAANPGVVKGNYVGSAGIYLMDGWYPALNGYSVHHLTAVLPKGFEGISEADDVTITEKQDRGREFSFSFPHPLANITLIAGEYIAEKDSYNGTDIYTYFLPEDAALSRTYIDYTKKYLEIYEKALVKYPFKRFSVVENIQPTGYSMPTFTLLGRDVVRLPFIVNTSLGHEILHQWFGNLVYVDYEAGNWSEGLTTYLADHMYEEIKGLGWDYRKQMLISFQSYVHADNDMPLKSFSGRTDPATRSIGYGKAAMVFHMLKGLVGEKDFYAALREFISRNMFRAASWNDIRETFEAVSGSKLDWFFRQWLEEKGALDINVKNVNLEYRGSKAVVSFDVIQKGRNYEVTLPVTIKTREGQLRKNVRLEKEKTSLEIETEESPLELIIDENYDLFRRLSDREFPPVISRLLGAPKKIFLVPEGVETKYGSLFTYLRQNGFTEIREEKIAYDDLKSASVILLNDGSAITRRLFGKIGKQPDDFSVSVKQNPYSKSDVMAVIDGNAPLEMAGPMRRITHYGKYSFVSFRDGKNDRKIIDESMIGIRENIAEDVPGIEMSSIVGSSAVFEKASGSSIIYAGELHDRFDIHRVQLDIIRALHKKGNKIAIGMEMFQKPFQKVLDDYIGGSIDEREFLKKSEYFKRWGFDYKLYREIMLYAKEFSIPVLALNIKKEIVSKVSKEGLYSLTADELREIPEDMDLSDNEYKTRLREFFEKHERSAEKNFDFFYQSQVLWDEAMAHNLDSFIKDHPEYQIIVLAGSGHMAFGSGIPKRAFRLNNKGYSIIVNNLDVEKDIADFLLFPEPVRFNESPRLMIIFKEEDSKVRITGFSPGSISEEAGLKKDDTLLALDDTSVEGIDDIKIFLLYKKKGDTITATVSRPRFLIGPAVMKFKIKL